MEPMEKVAGKEVRLGELDHDLEIHPEAIERSLARHGGTWAHWALAAERLRVEREGTETRLKILESDRYLSLRGQQGPDGKPLTEAGIKAQIALDQQVRDLTDRLLSAISAEREAAVMRDAFASRKDCLIAIAANKRAEFSLPGVPAEGVSPAVAAIREKRTTSMKGEAR